MKKVGIVSCYFKNNYGSLLQAYATQEILNKFELENETFNIDKNIDFKNGKKNFYKTQIFNISFINSKLGMIWLKIYKKLNRKLGKNINIREQKFKEFRKEFNLSKDFYTYKELNKASKNYSGIIVGSDQLWLPVNVVSDYYTLNWVDEKINKISLATSFGISEIPDKYNNIYKKFLNRLNYISVREESGCELVKSLIGKDAEIVCDPTILLTKKDWLKVQEKEPIIKEKYILCYFLGKNIEHRKFVERLKKETGYNIVSLNHCDEYVRYSDKFADITPYDIGPKEFVNLIRNAQYVCTDSFHGTVFSLINNVKFFTFERYKSKNNRVSTNSRIYSLLKIMNLENRILKGTEEITEVLKDKIDFKNVNKELEKLREKTINFLKNSLKNSFEEQEENNKIKYIQLNDKSECCGCTACKSICPKEAIEMQEDKEGFLYPKINEEKCINCGLCKNVCPIKNKIKEEKQEQKAYIVNNKNEQIRKESTSGGAFTPIAEYVIDKKGVVFGAAFDKDFTVCHKSATTKKELQKFRGSKYVQSDLKDTFKEAKQFLEKGKWVCFSGTPCQIEGLKKYLKKDYEKLITVDVVCRAVPSPLVLRKYLEYQKEKQNMKNFSKVSFRDKEKYGYKYTTMTLKNNEKIYQNGVETDPYLRAFFKNYSDRPSCYDCKFRNKNRVSDFTIWDCFAVGELSKNLDDNKGTTRMIVQNRKAKNIFNEIKNNYEYEELPIEVATKNVREIKYSPIPNVNREEFFKDINKLDAKDFFEKHFPDSIKVKAERITRRLLVNTKAYNKIKNTIKRIIKKG